MSRARTSLRRLTLVVVCVGLAGCAGDDDAAGSAATEPTEPTAASSSQEPTTPPAPDGWTPLPETAEETPIPPGRYGLDVNGRPGTPRAVVTVPEGFTNFFGWTLFGPGDVGLGYWTVSEVAGRPCGDDEGNLPMDAGSTVQDLLDALAEQETTRRTEPVPVTVRGHRGAYLELRVPRDLDVAACARGEYQLWESDPEGARHPQDPGTVDRVWVLDVDGEVVVLQVTSGPDAAQRDVRRVTRVLQSVEFVDWAG